MLHTSAEYEYTTTAFLSEDSAIIALVIVITSAPCLLLKPGL